MFEELTARLRLDGRTALVTGGTGVIGSAIARTLADAGATVVLVARNPDRLDEVASDIAAASGATVVPVPTDLRSPASIAALDAAVTRDVGVVDVLVNNAFSSAGDRPVVELELSDWEEPWLLNVMAPFQLCKRFGTRMMEGAGGSIVNITAATAFVPLSPMATYGATKAALWSMTRYLAKECAPKVRVNAVCPGTTSADGTVTFEAWRSALQVVPLGRMGLAVETAMAVLFLASDAASYTTGQNLFVDGGRINCLAGSVGGNQRATPPVTDG